jgi:ATP-dependent RNA helicase DeaD
LRKPAFEKPAFERPHTDSDAAREARRGHGVVPHRSGPRPWREGRPTSWGAIANEAGLDSKYIGRIDIQDDYTVLDLPKACPRNC